MTVEETSNILDTSLNKSYQGLIVNEYIKSIYLTRAQDVFVDNMLAQYEYGDKIRHILGTLLIEDEKDATDIDDTETDITILVLDENIKAIVYERMNDTIETIPLDFNDIHAVKLSPFRQPSPEIAYRITYSANRIKLLSSETFAKYYYIYCKIPTPIVLEDLPDQLELQGISDETESEFPYDSMLKVIELASELLYRDKARFMPKAASQN